MQNREKSQEKITGRFLEPIPLLYKEKK